MIGGGGGVIGCRVTGGGAIGGGGGTTGCEGALPSALRRRVQTRLARVKSRSIAIFTASRLLRE